MLLLAFCCLHKIIEMCRNKTHINLDALESYLLWQVLGQLVPFITKNMLYLKHYYLAFNTKSGSPQQIMAYL